MQPNNPPVYQHNLCRAADLEESLPPAAPDTLLRAADALVHPRVVLRVVGWVEEDGGGVELGLARPASVAKQAGEPE